MMLQIENI